MNLFFQAPRIIPIEAVQRLAQLKPQSLDAQGRALKLLTAVQALVECSFLICSNKYELRGSLRSTEGRLDTTYLEIDNTQLNLHRYKTALNYTAREKR